VIQGKSVVCRQAMDVQFGEV